MAGNRQLMLVCQLAISSIFRKSEDNPELKKRNCTDSSKSWKLISSGLKASTTAIGSFCHPRLILLSSTVLGKAPTTAWRSLHNVPNASRSKAMESLV